MKNDKYFKEKLHKLIEAFTIYPAKKADPILIEIMRQIAHDQRKADLKAVKAAQRNSSDRDDDCGYGFVLSIAAVRTAEIEEN